MISTAIEIAGFACLVIAAWIVYPIAGLVVLGAVLLLIGYSTGKDGA